MLSPLLLMAISCQKDVVPEPAVTAPARPLEFRVDDTVKGLEMRLSEAKAQAAPRATVSGEPDDESPVETLDIKTIEGLLARTDPLEEQAGDRRAFAKRADTKPPPRSGATELQPWPPAVDIDPPDVEEAELAVIRHSPEGEVKLAPYLSVTFNKAAIPLTTQDDAALQVPLNLSPEPPGQWRWIGQKTVLFEPDPRFPMATEYTVTHPETGHTFSFATPPVTVTDWWPAYGPVGLTPVIAVGFDQQVDDDILEFVRVRAGGDTVELVKATDEQVKADPNVANRTWEEGRVVLMVPAKPLKAATTYTLSLEKGAPSAEGPRTTKAQQSTSFYTYDPLRIDSTDCSTGPKHCVPGGALWVYLNNALDNDAFDPSWVTIEPAIENFRPQVSWSTLVINGDTLPNTTYTVTIDPKLQDQFGQTLGKKQTRKFKVGTAWPNLSGPNKDMVVLDPAAPPAFSVWSTNHKKLRVRITRVTPDDYKAVSAWMRDARYDGYLKGVPPGDKVFDSTVEVTDYKPEELVETAIDLAPYLDEGLGHLVVWVEPATREEYPTRIMAWVQATNIGLTAWADRPSVTGWATSLTTGAPLDGIELSLMGSSHTGKTDEDGLLTLDGYADGTGPHALVATRGKDTAILPEQAYWWNEWGNWTGSGPYDTLRWYVLDDRSMYRPSETVSIKGWVRPFRVEPGSTLGSWSGTDTLTWSLRDAYGNEIGKGEADVTTHGGFDFQLDLPDTPALGWASLQLITAGGSTNHSFQIQEFRRPEFEVSTSIDEKSFVLGEAALPSVNAAYYSGGPLPDAPVTWQVTATEGSFTPPGWSDWRFGTWTPWWGYGRGWDGGWGGGGVGSTSHTLEGVTDVAGNHHLQIDFLAVHPPRPMSVHAQATVVDVNRQRWTDAQTLLVHPADWYVGAKTDKAFYEKGDEVTVETIVVDIEGNPVEAEAELRIARLTWELKDGQYQQVELDPQSCTSASDEDPGDCEFTVAAGGQWRATATVTDDSGRPNETTFTFWVTGEEQKPDRSVAMEEVTLVPNGESWQPGDTAEVLVISPFAPAEGLLTLSRDGLVETRRFHLDTPTTTLEIPITDASIPGINLQVDIVGARPRSDDDGNVLEDKKRVAYAQAAMLLSVPPLKNTLAVTATPAETSLSPGGKTTIQVAVADAKGRPVKGADVVLFAVDESVLALSGYNLPDPLSAFYMQTGSGITTYHLRSQVVLADPNAALTVEAQKELGALGYITDDRSMNVAGGEMVFAMDEAESEDLPAAAPPMEKAADTKTRKRESDKDGRMTATGANLKAPSGGAAPSGPKVAVREDFNALALWAPTVTTGADGSATVELDLPDSLTRYRIMAVAADDVNFGHGESSVTARKPLMLRPSPPRFLNFGDHIELPLVVQNQTDEPMEVELALVATNVVVTGENRGRKFTVPANDRREIRLPLDAESAGTARFQVVVSSGDYADAARFELPVWTPATSEAFATYGELDDNAVLMPVKRPEEVWESYGGLEITTSSTALSALTDALIYLTSYPYDCSEQLASRILAVAALRDVLAAFEAEQLPAPAELEGAVSRDLERLRKRQKGNGGWGFWSDMPDEPYLTVHVTHSLVRAKEAGYPVDESTLANAMSYLKRIESHIPHWYGERARNDIIAYSVHVRHLSGDSDTKRARKLAKAPINTELSLQAQGWIAPTLQAAGDTATVDTLVRNWENKVSETSGAAHFVTSVTDTNDYVLLNSSRRVDAVLLESLIDIRPEHDLTAKVVRGLLGHRTAGRWSTTQENSFVLLSMNRFFREYESTEPDFVARAWLGETYAGEKEFKGYSPDRARLDVPMADVQDGDLILQKDGEGRLYYRVGLRYAPKSLDLDPADRGFVVTRQYEAIDDPADVSQDEDGTWHIAAGARVRVRLSMVAEGRRTYVALVDPLPAGLEAQNPALAVTGTLPADPAANTGPWWWWGTWYQHQNLRDERAEAFTTLLYAGVYEYTYVAVATTPGNFVVPPAKAEEMYHPETFGRTGTDRVIID